MRQPLDIGHPGSEEGDIISIRLAAAALAALAVATSAPAPQEADRSASPPAVRQASQDPPQAEQAPASIQWMDWSDRAFSRAAAERKPILLFVKASWSRSSLWAEEVNFADAEVIRMVNEGWVPIRVDRDRRPDIAMRYQVAVNAAFPPGGGLPLTAFLFDSGELLFGTTGISLRDRRDRPGLKTLLSGTAEFYQENKEKAAGTRQVVKMAFQRELEAVRPPEYSLKHLEEVARQMIDDLDREHGGFGEESGVPMVYTLELAGTLHHRIRTQAILDVLTRSLRGMEAGAIFDRVGGGFHRAASDPAWRVPEYPKLLNYNAPLLVNYLMGYEMTGDPDFKKTAESTLDYLLGTLRAPEGGFYVAQWAASRADEPNGTYYAWTDEGFRKAVPPALAVVARTLFNVTPEGDSALGPPARSLLYLAMTRTEAAGRLDIAAEALREKESAILAALARERSKASPPPIEKAIYVDSCSSAAIAMFEAYRVLARSDALQAGVAALDRLLGAIPKNGPLPHRVHPPAEPGIDPALALDHMMLARACLVGHETTGEARYLAAARDLIERSNALFWDGEGIGYFDIADDPNARGYLAIRRRLPHDTAYPALNSLAARVLARLALLTGDSSYRERGEQCLKGLVSRTREVGFMHGGLGLALDDYLRAPTRYVVVAPDGDDKARALEEAARRIFDPGKLVVRLRPGKNDDEIARLRSGRKRDEAFAVICRGEKCSEPAENAEELKERAPPPREAASGERGR